MTLPFDF